MTTTINLALTVECVSGTRQEAIDVLHAGITNLCERYGLKCIIAEDKPPDLADVSPVADCFARSNENIPGYLALDGLVSVLFTVGEIRRFLVWWNDVKATA